MKNLVISVKYAWLLFNCIFRFKSIKQMNAILNQQALERFITQLLIELKDFSLSEEVVSGYRANKLVTLIPSDDDFTFKLLSYQLVLKKVLLPMQGAALLKTYRIIDDEDDYPKKKLKELDMEIQMISPNLAGTLRFSKEIKKTQKIMDKEVATDMSGIVNFGAQYLHQVFIELEKVEKDILNSSSGKQ